MSFHRNSEPAITVITPSYNQGEFIGRTVESVLSQGIDNIEYLVFDGGSKDSTVSVLASFGSGVVWKSEPDKGQADAVNKGLKAARGQVIGWLNSDDVYYPGALQAVLDVFEHHPDVDVVYGLADHIDERDTVIEPYYTEEWNYERLKEVCYLCQPAVFFRKSVVDRHGLLNERLHYCMDYEYWLRIGRHKPFYFLKHKLAGSRLYASTKTLGAAEAVHEEILQMFKKEFGTVPARWIYNHAHAVAHAAGLKRNTSEENRKFVNTVVRVSLWDFLRLHHYVPPAEIRTLYSWFMHARKA